jgi:hypothetical protein
VSDRDPQARAAVELFEHITALYALAGEQPQTSPLRRRLSEIVAALDKVGEKLSALPAPAAGGAVEALRYALQRIVDYVERVKKNADVFLIQQTAEAALASRLSPPQAVERVALPVRDIPTLIEALRIRALALTGAAWERTATRDMMTEAAQRLEDSLARVPPPRVEPVASVDLEQLARETHRQLDETLCQAKEDTCDSCDIILAALQRARETEQP